MNFPRFNLVAMIVEPATHFPHFASPMSTSPRLTRRIFYSGRVQGVGFRATVQGLARHIPGVAGYVRNLHDGRVEVVAQGLEEDVEALLDDIAHRLQRNIQSVDVTDGVAVGELTGFEIWPTT